MARRILGAISLAMGLAILAWFAYNLVWPTREFQRSFRFVFQFVVPAAMIWYGWRWLSDAGPGIETLQIDPNAPELTESVEKAKQTMPAFLNAVRGHEDGTYIKFPLVTDAGTTEHIWGMSTTMPMASSMCPFRTLRIRRRGPSIHGGT